MTLLDRATKNLAMRNGVPAHQTGVGGVTDGEVDIPTDVDRIEIDQAANIVETIRTELFTSDPITYIETTQFFVSDGQLARSDVSGTITGEEAIRDFITDHRQTANNEITAIENGNRNSLVDGTPIDGEVQQNLIAGYETLINGMNNILAQDSVDAGDVFRVVPVQTQQTQPSQVTATVNVTPQPVIIGQGITISGSITNNGDTEVSFDPQTGLRHGADGTVIDSNPTSINVSNNVIPAGESVNYSYMYGADFTNQLNAGTVEIGTFFVVLGTPVEIGSTSVNATTSPETGIIDIMDVQIPSTVEAGTSVQVTVTFEVTGNQRLSDSFGVNVNGQEVTPVVLEGGPGTHESVFSVSVPPDADHLLVIVGGTISNEATVTGQPAPLITVENLSLTAPEPNTVVASLDLVNTGDAAGTGRISITVDGMTQEFVRDVPANSRVSIEHTFTGVGAGSRTATVRSTETGETLTSGTVQVPSEPTEAEVVLDTFMLDPATVNQSISSTAIIDLSNPSSQPASAQITVTLTDGDTRTLTDTQVDLDAGETIPFDQEINTTDLQPGDYTVEVQIGGATAGTRTLTVSEPPEDGEPEEPGPRVDLALFWPALALGILLLAGVFGGGGRREREQDL